jgi:hypothetical protein
VSLKNRQLLLQEGFQGLAKGMMNHSLPSSINFGILKIHKLTDYFLILRDFLDFLDFLMLCVLLFLLEKFIRHSLLL